jgi:hypothetical protein
MDQEKSIEKIEKIAIHLPHLLERRVLSFPFIHLIRESYPKAEIHLLCERHGLDILPSIPFEAFYHEYESADFRSIFHIHRLVKSWPIVEFDKFYSLESGFKSAFLGFILRAKTRIGFVAPWVKWFYLKTIESNLKDHWSDETFKFYEEATQLKVPAKFQVNGKRYTPYYQHLDRYIVIDVYPFSPGQLDEFWIPFIEMSENRTFVFFSSEEIEKGSLLIEQLIPRLSLKNKYYHFINSQKFELMQMLTHSQGLIAREGYVTLLHCYLGGNALIIFEEQDPRLSSPFYFCSDWQMIDLSDPTQVQIQTKSLIRKKRIVNPDILFERVEKFFPH